MIEKPKLIYRIVSVISVLFIISLFVGIIVYTDESKIDYQYLELDDEWSISTQGKEYENVTLSSERLEIFDKGDEILMERMIPEDFSVTNPTLEFYTVHSVIEVYIDDEMIYSYGREFYEQGRLLGYGENFISLPSDFAGKKLKVHMIVSEDDAFDGIPTPVISDGKVALKYMLAEKRLGLAISLFLIVFGLIMLVIILFTLRNSGYFIQFFSISLFSSAIGAWTLCNTDLILVFTDNLRVKAITEYISLYVLPFAFTIYFKDRVGQKETPKWLKIYYWILLFAEGLFFAITCILQVFGVVHFPKVLIVCHVLIGFASLFILCIGIIQIREKRRKAIKEKSKVSIAFGAALAIVFGEMIRYNVEKYITGHEGNRYSGILSIVAFMIVTALFIDMAEKVSKNLYIATKQKLLEDMAYKDELTGIANRRRCDDVLEELTDQNSSYALISIDMNGLKKQNDTYGHEKGDELLVAFADVMQKVFRNPYTVGRVGGDEFMVILPDADTDKVQFLTDELRIAMKESNLSAAIGVAYSSECNALEDAHAVYRKADERMYENKREMKRKKAAENVR